MKWIRASVMALGLLSIAAVAQESGVVLKDDVLRAEPFADAKTIGNIAKGAQVGILKKTGGWYQVRAGKTQGWVRMLSIRRGEATKADVGKEAGDLAALSSGRGGTGQIVSTTGIRGLSEEELKGAKFNEAQLRKAQSFAVSQADGQDFAAKAKLKVRKFDYLPEPAN
jgi:uncharacterized protein YgiM (DUF1202 family)